MCLIAVDLKSLILKYSVLKSYWQTLIKMILHVLWGLIYQSDFHFVCFNSCYCTYYWCGADTYYIVVWVCWKFDVLPLPQSLSLICFSFLQFIVLIDISLMKCLYVPQTFYDTTVILISTFHRHTWFLQQLRCALTAVFFLAICYYLHCFMALVFILIYCLYILLICLSAEEILLSLIDTLIIAQLSFWNMSIICEGSTSV